MTNGIGARETVDGHLSERTLSPGDTLLLCTDGLHGAVQKTALEQILASTADVDAAARTLVTTALDSGSRDNITALVVRYEG